MWYLGGKFRQSKEIVKAVQDLKPDFHTYTEPFCGAMWSACAVIKAFPDRKFLLNDVNPYLMCLWSALLEDWDPPEFISLETYNDYKEKRPINDPMTAYIGFAWSFGGKFFGGYARNKSGSKEGKGSYRSLKTKQQILKSADVTLSCQCFNELNMDAGGSDVCYLDPPYDGRTKQSNVVGEFDIISHYNWAESLTEVEDRLVVATDFGNPRRWKVVHNFGDTVVRHLNSKGRDGTEELLLLVTKDRHWD